MRLFYALWPDEATRAALALIQQPLQGRKTRVGNLHITLAFLGEQPATQLTALQSVLAGLAMPALQLTIDQLGYFKRQRIAWAGMQHVPDELYALQQNLSAALSQHQISFDQRNSFKPHVTLARDAPPPPEFSFAPVVWPVGEVALVQSVMEPQGLVYRVLASRSANA